MKICIVGGGSAGWITLSYLAATVDAELTIVHSGEIDPIGVGESTSPTIKHVADTVGVNEQVWMKDAKATFKYGVDFYNFNTLGSRWFHSFDDKIPHQCFHNPLTENGKTLYKKELTSIEYFLSTYKTSELFNKTHGSQEYLLENKLTPLGKDLQPTVSQYPGYSYHINAFEFGESLRKHTDKNRYVEIVDTVVDVSLRDNEIEKLVLKSGKTVEADVFFDCTGFKKLLIDKVSDWKPYTDLINDRAIWGPIKDFQDYSPCTQAHAQPYGWIWVTPTINQVGTGYVYSSKYQNEEDAVETIKSFWEKRGKTFEPVKKVKFESGRQTAVSCGNIVSNGLSQSFIEPLEATSIMVTCVTIMKFVEIYKKHMSWSKKSTSVHNKTMIKFIEHTKKFVHFHYRLSERTDTDYWKEVGNDPNAVQEVCDYIDVLTNIRWAKSGESLLNQFNWTSMLLGYDKEYVNKLPNIPEEKLENYKHYVETLQSNYKHLLRNNLSTKEYYERFLS